MSDGEAESDSDSGISLEEPLSEDGQEMSSDDEHNDARGNGGEEADADQGDMPREREVPQGDVNADAARAKALTRPVPMTKAQKERHWLEGHATYHPGCELCVRTRGLGDRHRRGDTGTKEYMESSEGVPVVGMDFCFLCQEGQTKSSPTLVVKDGRRKSVMATICPGKSTVAEPYSDEIVRRVSAFLDSLGYPRLALKSDQEPSMTALQERIRRMRTLETVLMNAKKGDSKANGMIEKAIQDLEGIVRTLKLHLEQRIGVRIPPNHAIMEWLVEYAAEMLNRFRIGADDKTAHERTRGYHKLRDMAEFGESVLWKREGFADGRLHKLEPKFENGIWLGIDPRNEEVLIGTDDGIVRAHTVKRRPEGPQFEREKVLAITVTPMKPTGPRTRPGRGVFDELVPDDAELEEVIKRDKMEELPEARRVMIRNEDIVAAGYSEGCQGCRAHRLKLRGQKHSEACRKHVE